MDPILEPYQYQRLSTPRSFRILEVERFAKDPELQKLCGKISEESIDNPPDYEALSYTWEDPTLSEQIVLDGRALPITQSAATVIRRMLRGKWTRRIWIDAVCIDQSRNPPALQERSNQVQLMAEIYRAASRVNVYLGEGDAESDAAARSLLALSLSRTFALAPGPFKNFRRRRYERRVADAVRITEERPYGLLFALFKRPWFQRTWVLQEVAMAKSTMFYCGNRLIHLEVMNAGIDFMSVYNHASNLPAGLHIHWKSYIETHYSLQNIVRRISEGETLPDLTLTSILLSVNLKFATRPEDKVYGLYGICKYLGFRLPEPDYRKSPDEVYTEAACCMIEQDRSLELLGLLDGSGLALGLPSWVPNLTGFLAPNGTKTFTTTRNFQAAGSSKYNYRLTAESTKLRVLGRKLGRIRSVGIICDTDPNNHPAIGPPHTTPQVFEAVTLAIQNWVQIAQEISTSAYPTGQPFLEIFVRTCFYDTCYSNRITPEQLAMGTKFISLILAMTSGMAPLMGESVIQSTLQELQNPTVISTSEGSLMHTLWKRMFTTDGGLLGMAPWSADAGDEVVLLAGCSNPFIVRPCSGGHQVIGPGYVHGVMDGEAWNARSESDDEWFIFV